MYYNLSLITCGYTVCAPNWCCKQECMSINRLYYIYGGEVICQTGNERYQLEKGCFYLFPVMTPYALTHNPDNPLDVLWFHVNLTADYNVINSFRKYTIEPESDLYYLLEAMKSSVTHKENNGRLIEMLDLFLKFILVDTASTNDDNRFINTVTEYIDSNLQNCLTVTDLAEITGLERSYFSRKFKTLFGVPPEVYLIRKKMGSAALMLLDGNSVMNTSQMVGYQNEKAFSRAFKNFYGVRPSDYTKNYIYQP